MPRILLAILIAATVLAAAVYMTRGGAAPAADRVFVGGVIWTGEAGQGYAEAMAIKGDHIAAVGSRDKVWPMVGPETEVIDLAGAFVTPGFIDNHVHFILGSSDLTNVELRAVDTREEFVRRIVERAQANPDAWVLGGAWDQEYWGGELPDRAWIDEGTGDTPVMVMRYDGHSMFVNSAVLKLAGIDDNTPDPAGGVIVRDANGRATGVLKDAAWEAVEKLVPAPTDAARDATMRAGILHALSHGVTQVHDMSYEWESLASYRRLKAQGQLDMRLYAFVPLVDWEKMDAFVKENGRGDDWLRWGGLKGFTDGSLGSTTAWFYEPYKDDPASTGLTLVDMAVTEERVISAVSRGLHVAVHAIGDRSNDELLDIFERVTAQNPGKDLRFRIEHAQHLSKAAIPRFAALNVTASMQPYHNIDDGRWAGKRLEDDRLSRTYAFKSLLDADARLTFGSDWPVAPLDPIMGIYAAVTRRTLDGANPEGWIPAQKISAEQALRAYTAANAYAGFQEDRLGIIRAGYLADFVVLSGNILEIDPLEIPDIKVLRTVIGGADKYIKAN